MTDALRLFADYHQIHLFDEGSAADVADAWTDEAVADNVAVAGDAIAVGTAVNVFVAVTVEVLQRPPAAGTDGFDHVVEGSMQVRSGRMVVMGCTDYEPDAVRFEVPVGWLRLRVSRSNLEVAARLGIDSDEDPATMERLLVQVWPAPPQPPVVVKRWQPAQP
ncbi:hypothetical protein OHA72_34020 [Dactylosporangium sp. NBC_01737]|uniref:hypothetical protein n=1 Tax=Dactylosporangium sp. NBC_01737 TaxID=2975959 RepID=UPI002E0D7CB1|nr:hypothetical protein OHA72_34020 [Dactylosporangium sp. NBC_01737]